MSALPRPLLSPQEYLTQERKADFKSEYYHGEVFAMAGASLEHTRIKDNFARKAGNALEGGECQLFTSDVRVKVNATGLYTYPDVVFVCGKPALEDDKFDTLLNPRIIVEILSDSTEKYDRGSKFRQYRQIPSLQEYVLITQEQPLIERYVRQADDAWTLTTFADPAGTFSLMSVPVQIPISEIYRGVTFPETTGR